jgi:transaldolase
MTQTLRAASKMRLTTELGADFWNDSCAPNELREAVENGATGATSNPVIVFGAVKADPKTWLPVVDTLAAENPAATEDEVAWSLIETLGTRAAAILQPVYGQSQGAKGFLSMQVNPKFYRDARRMEEHGRRLAAIAPNVAIKVPATVPGVEAGAALVASGINVNATVSFTLSQLLHAAESFERALDLARASGADLRTLHPYTTLMLGRLDDHLQRVATQQGVTIDPGHLHWAGVAVFKKARRIFRERGYRSTLLAAAYRHHLHWSQLVGPGVILTIPYGWWTQFEKSDVEVEETLDRPVDARIVESLYTRFVDFRAAYDEGALAPERFVGYGASVHTLNQFIGGYHDLLALVRERMLR